MKYLNKKDYQMPKVERIRDIEISDLIGLSIIYICGITASALVIVCEIFHKIFINFRQNKQNYERTVMDIN